MANIIKVHHAWEEYGIVGASKVAVEDLTNYNEFENRVEEQYMVLKRNITTQKWDKLPENSLQDKNWTYSFNNYDVAGKYWFNNCVVSDWHPAMLNLDWQGKVHGVLEVFESYVYNQTSTSTGGIVFQRFTTTNSGQQLQFTRRKAFWHNGTWGAWTMEQTNRQSVNRWKTYAFFGGSVCYNWNPLSWTAADNYAIEEILGVNSIRKRAISGAGWVAGNKIDNQITTELAEANPADVWVFWSSTNDHTAQVPIGDLDHKTDTTTVIGAMCNAVERVRTAKPTANILMTTPIRRFNNESGWNPYYDDGTTIPFYKYAEAVYTVANYYGIPVFDLWNNSGIDIKNYTTYMSDTIHPNANGYKLFQRELCKFCADGHTGNSMPVIETASKDSDMAFTTINMTGREVTFNNNFITNSTLVSYTITSGGIPAGTLTASVDTGSVTFESTENETSLQLFVKFEKTNSNSTILS